MQRIHTYSVMGSRHDDVYEHGDAMGSRAPRHAHRRYPQDSKHAAGPAQAAEPRFAARGAAPAPHSTPLRKLGGEGLERRAPNTRRLGKHPAPPVRPSA